MPRRDSQAESEHASLRAYMDAPDLDEFKEDESPQTGTVALTHTKINAQDIDGVIGRGVRKVFHSTLRGDAKKLRTTLRDQNRHRDILNETDALSRTALHIASYAGSTTVASTLLEYALEDLQVQRESALKRLKQKRRSLQSLGYGNESGSAAHEWWKEQCKNVEREHQFAEERAWIGMLRAQDANGWTPIHFAAQHNDPLMMRALLDGYGINFKNTELFERGATYDAHTGEI